MPPTTVSNAATGPALTPALRERILATARELGFVCPNPAARSLRRGRTGSIGLLFGETLRVRVEDPVADRVRRGLAQGMAEHNTALQLIAALDADQQAGAASLLADAIVDGLVVWTLPGADPLRAWPRAQHPARHPRQPRLDGVPFVGTATAPPPAPPPRTCGTSGTARWPSSPQPSARPGARARAIPPGPAGRATVSRASASPLPGRRRRPRAWPVFEVVVNSRDRGPPRGARAAAGHAASDRAARHQPPRPSARSPPSASSRSARPATSRWSAGTTPPSARASDPALTTICRSLHDQGRTCARLLLAAIRGELPAGDLVHLAPWELVARDSTAPPLVLTSVVSRPTACGVSFAYPRASGNAAQNVLQRREHGHRRDRLR